jgi:hypothetical protein
LVKDVRGHLHDAAGRFARTGAAKAIRNPKSLRGKSASSIRPRISESRAQDRYIEITNSALVVRNAFRRHGRGEDLQGASRRLVFDQERYGGPYTRLKNRQEAIVDATKQVRGFKFPRHTTKRTPSGKAYFLRGFGTFFDKQGNEHVFKPTTPKRNFAGKKGAGKRRIIDIRTSSKRGRHAAPTARQMMGRA